MDIKLFKKNESTLTVHCNSTISSELYNFFSCMSTNFRFDPRYKQGVWDGKLHFFNRKTNELSIGLYNKVFDILPLNLISLENHDNRIHMWCDIDLYVDVQILEKLFAIQFFD